MTRFHALLSPSLCFPCLLIHFTRTCAFIPRIRTESSLCTSALTGTFIPPDFYLYSNGYLNIILVAICFEATLHFHKIISSLFGREDTVLISHAAKQCLAVAGQSKEHALSQHKGLPCLGNQEDLPGLALCLQEAPVTSNWPSGEHQLQGPVVI